MPVPRPAAGATPSRSTGTWVGSGAWPRLAGEDALREMLPADPREVLDLGCGDGRLAGLVLADRPGITRVVAVDAPPPMLERACAGLGLDERAEVREWDLNTPIGPLGTFDLIVSGFAIHHLADARKQQLLAEIADQLRPGGLFANLEVVASPTPELHAEFLAAIGRSADDPEDRLVEVETQLSWMRDIGFGHVECRWRWRGFALLAGRGQTTSARRSICGHGDVGANHEP